MGQHWYLSMYLWISMNILSWCNVLVVFVVVVVVVSALGKIRSAVGSAQLLMSQKFQQFYWLCQQNLVRNRQWGGDREPSIGFLLGRITIISLYTCEVWRSVAENNTQAFRNWKLPNVCCVCLYVMEIQLRVTMRLQVCGTEIAQIYICK